jgi:hypothetical protein
VQDEKTGAMESMKLGTKIMFGFLGITVLVLLAGIAGYVGIERVGHALHVVAYEESPMVNASMDMMLSIETGKMLAEELKSATAAMATDDRAGIERISRQFEAARDTFDTCAKGILRGGSFGGGQIIKTENKELAALVMQVEQLREKRFDPAFASLKTAGMELLHASDAADQSMIDMEQACEAASAYCEQFEELASAEMQLLLKEADSVEQYAVVLRNQLPLVDCSMEVVIALQAARLCLEEVAQAMQTAEVHTLREEYAQVSLEFDAIVKAVLGGGNLFGSAVVATDNEKIRAVVLQAREKHSAFVAAADEMIRNRETMLVRAEATQQAMLAVDQVGQEMTDVLLQVEAMAGHAMELAKGAGEQAKQAATGTMIVVALASIVLGVLVGTLLTRSITKPVDRIITELSHGAGQVAAASGQLSSASQSLAEGASEQAAGLEETSSSLEEISSMTRQNATHAFEANQLVGEAGKAAENCSTTMGKMIVAVSEIQRSVEETDRIIKVIDEIAFQTNLLALNAAVEAARAGEAGKGFAVVAEEVRNLAIRSAEAARSTSEMIELSVTTSRSGTALSGEVEAALKDIISTVERTTALIGEIASASEEQAEGVRQVNEAVSQMDGITQQNAANAEESASATEELRSQAGQMEQIVSKLTQLVSGRTQV